MTAITKIVNIQRYLLAGFINDGHIEEYDDILSPEMFGRYRKQFEYLRKHGNSITPDFTQNIGGETYIELNQHYSANFIVDRNTYAKELIEYFYKEKLLNTSFSIEEYEVIKAKFAKLDYIDKQDIYSHIKYSNALEKGFQELISTNPNKVMSWGWKEFDDKLGYLMGGQLVLIGGATGTGKSTFINQVCYNVSKQGFKVARYSLEDRLEEKRKEELYYMIGRIRKTKNLRNYPWSEFEINNIKTPEFASELREAKQMLLLQNENIIDLEKKKQIKIEDLEKLIKSEAENGCKLFAIDHLHYFDMGNIDDRHDLIIQSVMHKINEIARNMNITILLVAHYKKIGKSKPTNEDFKDGNAISQVANKVIHLYRDFGDNVDGIFENKTQFIISKNRSPTGTGVIEGDFDVGTYEYRFQKSDMQRTREIRS